MPELNRRNFLAAAAATCACAVCGVGVAVAADEKADEKADDAVKAATLPKGPVDVGPLADFKKDGGYDKWNKVNILLVKEKGKLYAMTAVCTHKQFLVVLGDDGKFTCPKHGSRFALDGAPAAKANGSMGPAKTALSHYAIKVDDKGHVIVDTSKSFEKSKWGDPAASIKAE